MYGDGFVSTQACVLFPVMVYSTQVSFAVYFVSCLKAWVEMEMQSESHSNIYDLVHLVLLSSNPQSSVHPQCPVES